MKLTPHQRRQLHLPLLTLGMAIILATLLYSASAARLAEADKERLSQNKLLDQARNRYQTSGAEKDTIAHYLPLYRNLIQQGFIGEERRLDWIDDLRNVNIQNKLFGVHYDIGAMQDYRPGFPLDTGSFNLHRSTMKLTLAMLHEGDLLTLLETLPREQNPPFMLRDCTITRIEGGGRGKFLPNLNSVCEIDWLTVSEPNDSKRVQP